MQLKLLQPATEFPKFRSAFKLWFIFFEKEEESSKTVCIISTSSGVLPPCLPLFWLYYRVTPFPEETAHPSKAHWNLENLSLDFNGCQSMAITLCCSLFIHLFINRVTLVLLLQVYQFLCPCRNFTYFFQCRRVSARKFFEPPSPARHWGRSFCKTHPSTSVPWGSPGARRPGTEAGEKWDLKLKVKWIKNYLQ